MKALLLTILFCIFCTSSSTNSDSPNNCVCYMGNCAFYGGTAAQCFCYCNSVSINSKWAGVTITFFPSGEFSSGGCSCCEAGAENEEEKELGQVMVDEVKADTEKEEIDHLVQKEFLIKKLQRQNQKESGITVHYGSNPKAWLQGIHDFPYCICSNNCAMYIGTEETCASYCKAEATQYGMPSYKCTYSPHNTYSNGYCQVCGNVDPCAVHEE